MAGSSSNGGRSSGGWDSTYRVTIDIPRIQANVLAMEGGRLTELAVRNWLRSVGFSPERDGRTWLATRESQYARNFRWWRMCWW